MNQIKTADDLWKNEKLMSLNAELGLSMDALVKIADAMQSQAQQTKIKPALKVVNGEICYQSTDDDQSYGVWCPVVYDTVHDFAEGTKFFAIPPAPEVCSDGGKCGAGGYCITCPNVPAPEGESK